MDTINSILAPAGAAAKHLTDALHRIQSDFVAQAKKSGKGVRSDLGSARADLNEAISRLGDATDNLRDTISTSKTAYTESVLDKYHAGAEYARALKDRATALTLPNIGVDRRYVNRNNVLMATAAAGVGYAIYRLVKRMRAAPKKKTSQPARAASSAAKNAKPRAKKAARAVNAAIADVASVPPVRAH
jgi:hypothetical protein